MADTSHIQFMVKVVSKHDVDSWTASSVVVAICDGDEAVRIWIQGQLDTKNHYAKTVDEALGREYSVKNMTLFTAKNQ